MIRKFIAVLLAATLLIACGKNKGAFNYSQDIVAKEKKLEPEISKTENNIKRFLTSGEYDSMAAVSKRMEDLVQNTIDEVDAMEKPKAKEVDNFKAALMRYFRYIKSIYTKYGEVANAEDDEIRNTKFEELKELANEKYDEIRKMQQVQREYAKANGFKVQ